MSEESHQANEIERVISEATRVMLEPAEHRYIAEQVAEHVAAHYLPHEETASMVVASRLEELRSLQRLLGELTDEATSGDALDVNDVLIRLIEYVSDRRQAVKSLATRQPD